MDTLLTPDDIERMASEQDMHMAQVFRRANVAASTFYRWKHGSSEPTMGVYKRLVEAVSPKQP